MDKKEIAKRERNITGKSDHIGTKLFANYRAFLLKRQIYELLRGG